jgi:hypothetical protein
MRGSEMTKFLLGLVGYGVAIGMSILVMIHGWGLQPVSWGWIIGGGISGSFIGALFTLGD